MKLFKSLALITGMLFASIAFSACTNNDEPNDTLTAQSFDNCYAVVNDTRINDVTINSSVIIKLTLNWTKATAKVEMTGLTIGGMPYPLITLTDVAWRIDQDGWSKIEVPSAKASTATGMPITITDLDIEWLDRMDFVETIESYQPALEFEFVVDGYHKVNGSRTPVIVTGTTVSTSSAQDSFTNDQAIYTVSCDFKGNTASINIQNARFASAMPPLNIDFKNLPMTITPDGDIHIESAAFIPEMAGAPQPMVPISNLKADIDPGDGMNMTFVCNFGGKDYNVVADLDFTSYVNVTK